MSLKFNRGIPALFSALCAMLVPLALSAADYSWMRPGENVEADRIYLKIHSQYAPLEVKVFGGLVHTGNSALDAVADAFGVYRIEKTFMMEATPADPKVPDLSRYYTAFFPEAYGPVRLIEAYEACPEVEFAEWITIDRVDYIPNDARFRGQWHLSHCGFPGAWDISAGSPSVVIGIVDSGIDMPFDDMGDWSIHEDLEPNLWVNPGEDIDHNGIMTLDDWDGQDNDRNGYADDFFGWDLTGRDNWPHDEWARRGGLAHGTHVAGIASAATDNEIGVSGAGFNCRLMIAACYDYRSDGYIDNGYNGIEYCGRNRADIINCSWGSNSAPNRTQMAVVNYARSQGSIIFAAMGNDTIYDHRGLQLHHYPACYDGVIAVAACDSRDDKVLFSNWGDYVDLVAPGEAILSTFTNNDYRSFPGTSMASPLAAGLGALMLSSMRLNEVQLLDRMQRTAIDISARNQQYVGIRYRINAEELLNSSQPRFELLEWEIDEWNGNHDGRADPLEHIFFNITLRNRSFFTNANNVRISLSNPDSTLIIGNQIRLLGNINTQQSVAMFGQERLSFYVQWFSKPHYTTFTIRITADGGFEQTFEKSMTIGHPHYLLVDDDDGSTFESYYKQDLDQRPVVHDMWSMQDNGDLTAEYLQGYTAVIWAAGNARNPLTVSEQAVISAYLNGGGYLLLTGQFIGDDLGNTDFHRDVLRARHITDNTNGSQLFGEPGGPCEGMRLLLVGGAGAGNGRISPSAMEPLNGARPLLNYDNGSGVGGIIYTGQYGLVYLGFALEGVSGMGGTTPRTVFIERLLDLFYQLTAPDEPAAELLSSSVHLSPAYPNPFNGLTEFRVELPYAADYRLEVVDAAGHQTTLLHIGGATAGMHQYFWNASAQPAGIYFIRLSHPAGTRLQKVVLVK